MNPDLPDDFISMWVADQDFACAPPILEAMKKRLERRVLGYSIILDPTYKQSVVNWMKRRHGWTTKANQFIFTAGVVRAVDIAVETLTKKGEGVILNTPAYHPFEDIPKKKERKLVLSPLLCDEKGYYTVNYDELEKLCQDPNNKLFIFCNPHNPTGRVWKKEEIRKVADICFKHNIFIVSDEIHSDLLRLDQYHIPLGKLYPNEKRMIVCTAPSKTFNLAANALSNIYVPDPEMRNQWEAGFLGGFPSPLSMEACKAAYNECEPWLEQLRVYLDANFKLLADRLQKELPEAVHYRSEGTYLAWIDFTKLGFSDDELKRRITRAGVFIEYASDFVANGENHVRMNLSCPRSLLDEAITRIVNALKNNYESPQFQGQLKQDNKFPAEQVKLQINQSGKTVVYFLRHFACPLTRLVFRDIELHASEYESKKIPVHLFINSSEEYYNKYLAQSKLTVPSFVTVHFDLKGEFYDIVHAGCAKNRNCLVDRPTFAALDLAEDLEYIEYENEPGVRSLQRPATFIISNDGNVSFAKYGHGAGDVPSSEELLKLL
ncbi:hypothetical protein TRFO_41205 [Tritrichomonas foetus]|uniref:cysteine-S-conjugate beta-lyase n=1 Tax=Tritrichomonas foetus TaxID=1144522 RepID=A0A1J4L187_9EUKA|nr:hypothetical protein TRFO_41205 [Tritrichomonas foetus]|eukprot:OHT17203.1 hypothetical protein TRFO_41205 [Tritrichomonas foetus]